MTVDRETTCGLFGWRPAFLQPLASKKVYMFIYGILGIIQSMFFTYLSATLSTLERKFGIKSKEAAYMMSGNEISQFLFLFAMPFMVKVKRRPLWTAVGLCCTGIGCLMMAVPHLISGDHDTLGAVDLEKPDKETLATAGLCGSDYHPSSLEGACDGEGGRKVDWLGLIIVFIGIVLTGIGNCVFWSFGVAYLDDNTSHENSPIMLSITYTFRLLGPTLGFFLGSFCLRTYVNPSIDPGFSEGDPRWMGAWWLGYPIIGGLLLFFTFPLTFFPQRLPKQDTDASRKEKEKLAEADKDETDGLPGMKNMKDKATFMAAFKRLLRNKLFMYNFFSSIFYVFAFMGFGTFMPKYIEYQFRKKGSRSSSLAGSVGTISKALGLLISGFLISRFKPSARFISGYNVLLGFMYFLALLIFSMLGCPTSHVYGKLDSNGVIDISGGCNLDCACPSARLQPVCSKDGVTNFYSACQAGCLAQHAFTPKRTKDDPKPKDIKVFEQCSCVLEAWHKDNASKSDDWIIRDHLNDWNFPTADVVSMVRENVAGTPIDSASAGWCPVDCDGVFKTFMLCMFVLMVLGSTGRIGNVIVALRCIDVEDKSLSMAFNVVFMSLFAMLPAPMVYGAIIDNTCLLWQEECGSTTNCLLYDTDKLRLALMLTTAFIMLVGVFFDIGVWYHAKDLEIFSPKELEKEDSENDEKSDKVGMYASNLSLNKDSLFKNGMTLNTGSD